jgi:hypothetical protein
MAVVSMKRADYVRPNVRIGGNKRPKRVASPLEIEKINLAIVALNDAKLSTNEPEFLVRLSDAVKIARDLWRGRNDV